VLDLLVIKFERTVLFAGRIKFVEYVLVFRAKSIAHLAWLVSCACE